MICTNCNADDGIEWVPAPKLSVAQIIMLCQNWLCKDCMDKSEPEEK